MIIIPVSLFICGASFIWPSAFAIAFEPFSHIAGYAGAIYGCIQIIGGAFFSAILANIPENNAMPLSVALILSGALAWTAYRFIVKPTMKYPNKANPA